MLPRYSSADPSKYDKPLSHSLRVGIQRKGGSSISVAGLACLIVGLCTVGLLVSLLRGSPVPAPASPVQIDAASVEGTPNNDGVRIAEGQDDVVDPQMLELQKRLTNAEDELRRCKKDLDSGGNRAEEAPVTQQAVRDIGAAVVAPQDKWQAPFEKPPLDVTSGGTAAMPDIQGAIREEFLWAWNAYERMAWGQDVLKPVSQRGEINYGMGLTIIDSLDTLLIMDLREEYDRAVDWIRKNLRFDHQEDINLFETTIRALGGLLSAYSLSNEPILLEKATELADAMIFAFDTDTGLPMGTLKLGQAKAFNPPWSMGSSVSEVLTLQLEWAYLSQVTDNPVYQEKVDRIVDHFLQNMRDAGQYDGLLSQYIDPKTGKLKDNRYTFGSRVDSSYEYLLKYWLLTKKTRPELKDYYEQLMDAMETHLLTYSTPSKLPYLKELHGNKAVHKMDHLVCFVPGMLALGAVSDDEKDGHRMELANQMTETCYETYARMPTGLSPEITLFTPNQAHDFEADFGSRHNQLRPETVESVFVLWRKTQNPRYRKMGWDIFSAMRKWTKVSTGGYSSIRDVTVDSLDKREFRDVQESFFLAETLKYLYLLFSDSSVLDLDQWVFNTEAHPLPIEGPGTKPGVDFLPHRPW